MTNPAVLITGCSSGFGRHMVTSFLEDGWKVFASMRRAHERKGLFEAELQHFSERLVLLDLDVTSSAQRQSVSAAIEKNGGHLDCLVNNAGFMLLGALEETTEEEMRSQFETNFFGPVLLIQELLTLLRARKGLIMNVSSVFGFLTWPLSSLYCASKFALEGVSESLWQEVQSQGVRVVVLEPGQHGGTALADNIRWGSRDAKSNIYKAQTDHYRDFHKSARHRDDASLKYLARQAVRIARKKSPPLRVQFGPGMSLAYRLTRFFPELVGVRLMRVISKFAAKL